ncbi:MAG: cytochrome c-type biogenesis protein CcmH [Proteobacteria bacterium]|nr:cytochrome c-type biogenesis protein CcmH [Pseudomonadota bacterium]
MAKPGMRGAWLNAAMVWAALGLALLLPEPVLADAALEDKVQRVASELRCLVCQNDTIAASQAPLAVDLRNQVRRLLAQGQSEAQVLEYMTQRYGDFVRYRPPLKPSTWPLWFMPVLLLLLAGLGWWRFTRARPTGAQS